MSAIGFLTWRGLENLKIEFVSKYCKHEIKSYIKIIPAHQSICGWSNSKGWSLFKVLEGELKIYHIDVSQGIKNVQAHFYMVKEADDYIIGYSANTWYLLSNESDKEVEVLVFSEQNMWENQENLKMDTFRLLNTGQERKSTI